MTDYVCFFMCMCITIGKEMGDRSRNMYKYVSFLDVFHCACEQYQFYSHVLCQSLLPCIFGRRYTGI